MSEKTDRVKEILTKNADGQTSNSTTVLEVEALINEYVAAATHRAYEDGYNSAIGAAHWTETWRGIE